MKDTYLLFDIGGTHTRLAISRDGANIDTPVIIETSSNFEEEVNLFVSTAKGIVGKDKIKTIVGGVAGSLNREKTTLINSPHLPNWSGKNLVKEFSQKFDNIPVYLQNDAALEALGEAVEGAGKGYGIVAYLSVGTGIGGARVVNESIDVNAIGFEPGHQILSLNGGINTGNLFRLEECISGSALEKIYAKKAYEITDAHVWEEVEKFLAIGINNATMFWSPDIIIVGGSLTFSISLERVNFYLKDMIKIYSSMPIVTKAMLDDRAGLLGALIYAKKLKI